jgi:hypothetical protein
MSNTRIVILKSWVGTQILPSLLKILSESRIKSSGVFCLCCLIQISSFVGQLNPEIGFSLDFHLLKISAHTLDIPLMCSTTYQNPLRALAHLARRSLEDFSTPSIWIQEKVSQPILGY